MKLGAKYKVFIKHKSRFDILEGTTYSGKTTVGASVKLMFEIAKSPKRFHFISGRDLGVAEKNIINSECGILKEWGDYVEYKSRGSTAINLPHIIFHASTNVDKIIYVFGYDDKTRWEKILGGQFGCGYIDEANIADIDFIQEASIRCDYMLWTLNPDNPDLDIYSRYINHSRPLQQYVGDYPQELLSQLDKPHKEGYTHWYFTFGDNIACTQDKKELIISNAPVGSKLYKNKILGLRGVANGGAYGDLLNRDIHLVPYSDVNIHNLECIYATLDIGSSLNTDNADKSATVLTIGGYTRGYQRCIVLASYGIPATSYDDIIEECENKLEYYWIHHYDKLDKIIIDSEDPIMIRTWNSRTRYSNINIMGAVKYVKDEITLVSRCIAKQQLIIQERLLWTERALQSYQAHEQILLADDGSELDENKTKNDYANALDYLITEEWRNFIENPKRRRQ